ncbi:PAS domain S-box protein [uncultured Sunxiuqinia sp.]|uniref:PAS domain S-box protein n=1 Tax=uncultured Sunxiuqinia sp. TaxID=1573825 RepID=UPI002AA6FE38|nr:PAS domain S-box protein [uncultured Sunxiuqinia sp.]
MKDNHPQDTRLVAKKDEIENLKNQLKEEQAKNAQLRAHLEQLKKETQIPVTAKKTVDTSALNHSNSFNDLAIPVWEIDFSPAYLKTQELNLKGITDLHNHFSNSQADFIKLLKSIKILNFNTESSNFSREIFGKKQDELSCLFEIYQAQNFKSIVDLLSAIQKTAARFRTEISLKLPNGEKKYYILKWISTPGQHNYNRILISFINNTDRRIMDKKLMEANRRLSTLIGNLKGIVYRCLADENWMMSYISDTVFEMTGYRSEELINNKKISYANLIHPADRENVEEEINKAIAKKSRFTIEYRIITKDGKERWFWEQGTGVENKNNEIEFLEGYIIDITERKKAEQALLESEEKFKKAFQSSPTVIILTSALDGKIIEANDSFEQITGWKKEEYLNKTTNELGLWADLRNREEYIRLLMRDGSVKNKEYDFCLKSREVRNALVSGHILKLTKGTVILGVLTDITQQKETRRAINNERIHLRTVIETIPDLVWLKDVDGVYLNCNYQFEQFFGAREKDIVGKTDYDFVDKELADFFRKNDQAAMRANQPKTNLEWVTFASDNHQALLETIKTPMRDCTEKLIGVLGIARDITEKKKNEDALKQSEILYKAIFKNTGTATCIIDEDKTLLLGNEKMEELTGYSKDELENKMKWTDFVSPEDLQRMQLFHETRRKNEEKVPSQYEFTLVDRKYKKHHILLSIHIIDGTTMSVASLLDITVRINALNELKRSHEKYQNLVENINDIFFEIDSNWDFSYLSPSFETLSGYSVNSFIGQPFTDAVLPEDLPTINVNFNDLINDQVIPTFEFRLKTKNNELIWIRNSARPIYDKNNEIIGARGIGINITEQKETEIQLINAKEKAEQADHLKSAFLATMSHELRTPLNAIIGFSQLMDGTISKSEMIEMAKIIFDSGSHLLSIIESIFHLTMLQSKQAPRRIELFTLADLYKSLRFYLESELSKKDKNHIEARFDDCVKRYSMLQIQADKTKLTQLLTNLLNNAVKYTDSGSITMSCKIDGKDLIFFVKDTGIGIPKDKQELIFERFRQIDDTSTRKYEGVGLGLAICKEICDLLRGEIWIESEVEQGSTFYFKLPNAIFNKQ